MTDYTWSYSALSTFQQCPRKYYRIKVAKDIKEPMSEVILYGQALHKAAEDYVGRSKPIPEKFSFIKPYLDVFLTIEGERYCEYRMGLTKELEPCEFFAKDVWLRSVADLLIISGDTAFLVDYKTGKSQYADTKQLELMALCVFKHFPQVKLVKGGLLFVVTQEFIEAEYTPEGQKEAWMSWFDELIRLEGCYDSETWNPSPNFSCKKFCPVTDCEYHGNNGR
jgi:CRISPR/Cas system-associated exonuclease Cas4 (RecB family)